MPTYNVIVGNVGSVYAGKSKREAMLTAKCYEDRSRDNRGRCAGESVTVLRDGEVIWEYLGTIAP